MRRSEERLRKRQERSGPCPPAGVPGGKTEEVVAAAAGFSLAEGF